MPRIRIAQAQINPIVGDLAYNLELVKQGMETARQAGADLVTFPELCLCGYPPEDLLLKPRFLEDVRRALELAVEASRGVTAVVGFADQQGEEVFNAAALIHQGRLAGVYHKMELPNYGVFDEKRYFSPGRGCMLLELAGVRVMLTICEDLWVPGCKVETCARTVGVGLTLNISASPFHAGKLSLRRRILADYARRTGTTVCYTNLVGGQDELVFDGGSLVVDPRGELVACSHRFQPDFLVSDLELPAAEEAPPVTAPDRLLELGPGRGAAGSPLPPGVSNGLAPQPGPVEEVYQALVLGTGDYVRKNGFHKVVLGLSGGIDSSLTAAVAVDALGAENVVGVTMPSQYTSRETKSDAEILAQNLGITLHTVPIQRILSAYLEEMGPVLGPGELGVVAENLQARIRGNILMGLSNRFGWLVLTTGNKSETAVGYCTLYGDMAGGFAVIKDVPKTLVYELSHFVNQKAGREIIPHSVLVRPPTAELRPDQKDEDTLPPYELLDPILKSYVEEDKVLDDIAATPEEAELVARVVHMVDLNEYKRRQAPPGIKITPKAFGKDRRLPITNHYRPGMIP